MNSSFQSVKEIFPTFDHALVDFDDLTAEDNICRVLSPDKRMIHGQMMLELLLTFAVSGPKGRTLAKRLLSEFGYNLSSIFDAPIQNLLRIEGMEPRSAVLIAIVSRLHDYYYSSRWLTCKTLDSTEAVVTYLKALIGTKRNEVFCVLALDSQNKLIAVEQVQKGTVNRAAVFPRQVIEICLKHHATAVILAHNHPGGSILPSDADRRLTKKLGVILGELDIVVHDHIIIAGQNQYYSFAETEGLEWSSAQHSPSAGLKTLSPSFPSGKV